MIPAIPANSKFCRIACVAGGLAQTVPEGLAPTLIKIAHGAGIMIVAYGLDSHFRCGGMGAVISTIQVVNSLKGALFMSKTTVLHITWIRETR